MKILLTFLFPSWRLFDDAYDSPILFLRKKDGKLIEVFTPLESSWRNIFYNPFQNYYLYYHSAINRFLNELAKEENLNNKLEKLNEFKIIKKLIISSGQYETEDILQIINKKENEVLFEYSRNLYE